MPIWPLKTLLLSALAGTSGLSSPNAISGLSRLLGIDRAFHARLVSLLDLGYKCRVRLPLFISAGFFLCHLFSNYVPRVEINVQVVDEEEEPEREEDRVEGDREEAGEAADIEDDDEELQFIGEFHLH